MKVSDFSNWSVLGEVNTKLHKNFIQRLNYLRDCTSDLEIIHSFIKEYSDRAKEAPIQLKDDNLSQVCL